MADRGEFRKKIVSPSDFLNIRNGYEKKRTVVFTNGCFDILHAGHVYCLGKAASLGDLLVVGLNSDSSVRLLKGEGRPVNPQEDRAVVLAALGMVDFVIVFNEKTPEKLIRRVHPDIHVKGGDYSAEELPETALVRSWGGEVVIVPFLEGRSTSGMLRGITGHEE